MRGATHRLPWLQLYDWIRRQIHLCSRYHVGSNVQMLRFRGFAVVYCVCYTTGRCRAQRKAAARRLFSFALSGVRGVAPPGA